MPDKKKTPAKRPRRKKPAGVKKQMEAAELIEALRAHILGEREMTPSQVNAALALLKQLQPPHEDTAAPKTLSHEEALEFLK